MQKTTTGAQDIARFEHRALLMLSGLEESGRRGTDRAIILGIAMLLAGLVAWAAVTRLPEVAVAAGQVATEDPVAQVQHLEGGIVEAVLVSDGEHVREGQPLLRFASAQAQGELERLRAREAGLRFREAHLRAMLDGRPLELETDDLTFVGLAADQRLAHEERLRSRDDRLAVLRQSMAQREAELGALSAQQEGVARQVTLQGNELALRETLLAQGLTTRIAVLETRRAFLAASAEVERLAAMAEAARRAAAEAEARLAEAESSLRDELARDLGRIAVERLEVAEAIREAWERVGRLVVLSPVAGTVKGTQVRRAGAVVPPGAPLMEIVPDGARLLVEARISPRDIGFVSVGQPVRVKVHAFDYARFGTTEGTIVHLAAGTTLDADNQPFYAARIALASDHVGRDMDANRLIPGMTVQADVVTGGKTLLAYLMKPVHAAMSDSFRER
ncbi:HlyD family type I secretion periplasmic adaptor subunit [Elioraea rosea]|uniref:HlyD family type I secretion periplasmic adaptor subunit n=1 Tax=Elioraea rosea TaxID=2492390 RepID=UPI0011820356|nr:HlyD family type I secretion periplasmic adaptor subunit [Elioraea rosea]